MNTLLQKLHDSETMEEFANANNEIQKAINANPAEMLKELEAAYKDAQAEANYAREQNSFAQDDLNRDETIENKAFAWDAYWASVHADEYARAIYDHIGEAGFQAEYPEEVERMKNAEVVTSPEGEFPF